MFIGLYRVQRYCHTPQAYIGKKDLVYWGLGSLNIKKKEIFNSFKEEIVMELELYLKQNVSSSPHTLKFNPTIVFAAYLI